MSAHHGVELAQAAEAANVALKYEAAVAGGIPVIKGLREGAPQNEITHVYGILNGTCNYILTTMESEGRDFADVLADAQALGYAKSDPSFDIDGIDAAHKLITGRHCRSVHDWTSTRSASRAFATCLLATLLRPARSAFEFGWSAWPLQARTGCSSASIRAWCPQATPLPMSPAR